MSNTIEPLHAFRIFRFFFIYTFSFTLFDLTCKVLAPDEFRDVSRNLDPLLSCTPAVGSKRSCLAPNVTPMRPPKRNTLIFTVAARSFLKFTGSIKIDISKQNRSDQLFEFQTEEKIFPPWCCTNINKPPLCYRRRDLRCLQ